MRDPIPQRHIKSRGRYVRDRHSRLVEQNRALEKTAKKRRNMSVIVTAVLLLSLTVFFSPFSRFGKSSDSTPAAAVSTSSVIRDPAAAPHEEVVTDSSAAPSEEPLRELVDAQQPHPEEPDTDVIRSGYDYNVMLDTAMGSMFYYNQADPLWADYLWGGTDRMDVYGCGPTVMAMLVNAFGTADGQVTPADMADFAVANHQFSPGHGSMHSIVDVTAQAYGLTATSMQDRLTVEDMRTELSEGHILVALVKTGYFTDSGHFLLLTKQNDDGSINVADPNSLSNTLMKRFDADFLLNELMTGANDSGSPLWSISRASTSHHQS